MNPLISFCVPTYQGERHLPQLLKCFEQMALNHTDVEYIFCDDVSGDRTPELLDKFCSQIPTARVIHNEVNLGMDGNFTKCARQATGRFVWFSGQDDLIDEIAVQHVKSILQEHPETGLIYFNFHQKNDDLTTTLQSSVVRGGSSDVHFLPHESTEFLDTIKITPSFLPATVMRRECWENPALASQLDGTKYVQMGLFVFNLPNYESHYVADPTMITCRIPDDGWQQDGHMQFNTMTGSLEALRIVKALKPNAISESFYRSEHRWVFKSFLSKTLHYKTMGLRMNLGLLGRLIRLLGPKATTFLFYLPVAMIPRPLAWPLFSGYLGYKRWRTNGEFVPGKSVS